jgi:hypothetical protein
LRQFRGNCITNAMKSMRMAAAIGLVLLALAGGRAVAETRYTEWQGPDSGSGDIAGFLKQLKSMIDEAAQAKAADPLFIQDLRDLIASYENPISAVLFYDDFKDGNYTQNPAWTVSAGQWGIDHKGANTGLTSTIIPPGQVAGTSGRVTIGNVLGAILLPQGQTQQGATYASIYTPVAISNTFRMKVQLASVERFGRLDFGPYQGQSGNYAYRVTYYPNAATGLQLQRVTPQGVATLASYNQPLFLEDGKGHLIEFQRNPGGAMIVAVDGTVLLNATDNTLKDPMNGLLFINSGGHYIFKAVSVEGKK